jgi:hypothetical protein
MANPVFDHLVIAARTLEEGASWVEAKLGAAPGPGGKHPLMGTHNRVMKIGPREFLEVIAIDPQAPAPTRPRWFELDAPAMQARLAAGPALVHWVERTDDLEASLVSYPERVDIVPVTRGAYRWRIVIPPDGRLPGGGTLPTLIQWEGGTHPADAMAESGCRLHRFTHENGVLIAAFATPSGLREIMGGPPPRPE